MYKRASSLSNEAKKELCSLASRGIWKSNKGDSVNYATMRIEATELSGINLPWRSKEVWRAMFINIPPGGKINRHSDNFGGEIPDHTRYHVILLSNSDCISRVWVDNVEHAQCLREGEIYSMSGYNENPHASENNGTTDRLHLVIDIYES